jgi:hypothetical protein
MDRLIPTRNAAHRDPITGAEGAHPLGTGLGAAGGAATGAALGAPAGPLGAVVGAAAGGVIGGLVGKGAAEVVNPTLEDAYWREAWAEEPYARTDFKFEDYEPAYRVGYLGAARRDGRTFEDAEPQLREQYERVRGGSPLHWDAARVPAQAAWDRVAARGPRED